MNNHFSPIHYIQSNKLLILLVYFQTHHGELWENHRWPICLESHLVLNLWFLQKKRVQKQHKCLHAPFYWYLSIAYKTFFPFVSLAQDCNMLPVEQFYPLLHSFPPKPLSSPSSKLKNTISRCQTDVSLSLSI